MLTILQNWIFIILLVLPNKTNIYIPYGIVATSSVQNKKCMHVLTFCHFVTISLAFAGSLYISVKSEI